MVMVVKWLRQSVVNRGGKVRFFLVLLVTFSFSQTGKKVLVRREKVKAHSNSRGGLVVKAECR